MRRAAATALALVVAAPTLGLAAPATAATAAPPERASLPQIEHEVMCVVCGVPLEVAESPAAEDQRRFISRLIARGETEPQIKRALVAQYGADVLAVPHEGGFDVTAWLVPMLVVAALGAAAIVLLPRWRRRRPERASASASAVAALDPHDARRLDEDLARFDP